MRLVTRHWLSPVTRCLGTVRARAGVAADDSVPASRTTATAVPSRRPSTRWQYVAERVAGDHAEVANLTQPGAEPHDLELHITETAEIADADLVVSTRSGFQPAVDDGGRRRDADGATVRRRRRPCVEPSSRDHDDEERPRPRRPRPALLAGPAAAGRRSPTRSPTQLGRDRPRPRATTYARQRRDAPRDLERSTREYADGLADCERDHGRGQPRRVRLPRAATASTSSAIAGLSPDAEPTPADLARAPGPDRAATAITTVFSERLVSPKLRRHPRRRPRRQHRGARPDRGPDATTRPTRTTCP